MWSFTFGKAKVRVEVEGCMCCGTLWSWRWGVAKEIAIQVGERRAVISLAKCGECLARAERQELERDRGKLF